MVYAAALLAATVVGFGYNLDPATRAPDLLEPRFVVHGLACLAWLTLLLIQAALVGSGKTKTHRRLGQAAPFVAGAVVISSAWVGIASLMANGWVRLLTYGNVAARCPRQGSLGALAASGRPGRRAPVAPACTRGVVRRPVRPRVDLA